MSDELNVQSDDQVIDPATEEKKKEGETSEEVSTDGEQAPAAETPAE